MIERFTFQISQEKNEQWSTPGVNQGNRTKGLLSGSVMEDRRTAEFQGQSDKEELSEKINGLTPAETGNPVLAVASPD